MALTSTRIVTATISGNGQFQNSFTFNAVPNALTPGSVTIHTLASGTNTITIPTGGSKVEAATIIPPVGNTTSITVKGSTGDTGIALGRIDPTSIALDTTSTTQSSLLLVVGATITGLHIIWT